MSKQHPLDQAKELYEVAAIYVEDGAFRTAADRLRKCADMLEQHARNCEDAEGAQS